MGFKELRTNVLRMNMKVDVLNDRDGNQCGRKEEKQKRGKENTRKEEKNGK